MHEPAINVKPERRVNLVTPSLRTMEAKRVVFAPSNDVLGSHVLFLHTCEISTCRNLETDISDVLVVPNFDLHANHDNR